MCNEQIGSVFSHHGILDSWSAQLSFNELITLFRPALDSNTSDWTKETASLFIDSILVGVPVPSLYIAILEDTQYIIDGFQRIKTTYDFIYGRHSFDNNKFVLGIKTFWSGKDYATLEEFNKSRITNTTMNIIIVKLKDKYSLIDLSLRINPNKGVRETLKSAQ